jgi:hypothetical protein
MSLLLAQSSPPPADSIILVSHEPRPQKSATSTTVTTSCYESDSSLVWGTRFDRGAKPQLTSEISRLSVAGVEYSRDSLSAVNRKIGPVVVEGIGVLQCSKNNVAFSVIYHKPYESGAISAEARAGEAAPRSFVLTAQGGKIDIGQDMMMKDGKIELLRVQNGK